MKKQNRLSIISLIAMFLCALVVYRYGELTKESNKIAESVTEINIDGERYNLKNSYDGHNDSEIEEKYAYVNDKRTEVTYLNDNNIFVKNNGVDISNKILEGNIVYPSKYKKDDKYAFFSFKELMYIVNIEMEKVEYIFAAPKGGIVLDVINNDETLEIQYVKSDAKEGKIEVVIFDKEMENKVTSKIIDNKKIAYKNISFELSLNEENKSKDGYKFKSDFSILKNMKYEEAETKFEAGLYYVKDGKSNYKDLTNSKEINEIVVKDIGTLRTLNHGYYNVDKVEFRNDTEIIIHASEYAYEHGDKIFIIYNYKSKSFKIIAGEEFSDIYNIKGTDDLMITGKFDSVYFSIYKEGIIKIHNVFKNIQENIYGPIEIIDSINGKFVASTISENIMYIEFDTNQEEGKVLNIRYDEKNIITYNKDGIIVVNGVKYN